VESPPSGTVTFLFTDIEGSTRLWEERPDEMRAALAEHDAIVRAAIDAHGGYVFSTGGDGFAVAFARANDAIAAARKAQASLAEHPLIKVRMGIHTGEVQERDGDYFGPAVNLAARIGAAAHGGQIAVSAATAELSGVSEFSDLGVHRLRDVGAAQHLFQLGTARFDPLRTADAVPGNLPPPVSNFIGRVAELAAIIDLLHNDRVVTLTGVGGVGKTRLALEVGHRIARAFPDGAWLVELADVRADDDVGGAVAAVLGIAAREGRTMNESLVEALRVRNRLLILDNCEHLRVSVATLVSALIRGCPDLRVLATSREALGVGGERPYVVPSLSVDGAASEAVALFFDRVPEDRRMSWPEEVADDIAALTKALDGIPLAIELAAARAVSLAPAEILARLTQRFRLLGGRGRQSHDRHQTLRATVDWSFRLLSPQEQTLFRRLAVFVDGFALDSAHALVPGLVDDDLECLDLLEGLVSKSMVIIEGDTTSRYRLLETMRQFAWEQLVATEEVSSIEHLHAEHFLAQARSWRPIVFGDGDLRVTGRVGEDLANLRTAIGWLLDEDRAADAALIYDCAVLVLWGVSVRDSLLLAEQIASHCREERDDEAKATVLGLAAHIAAFSGLLSRAYEDAERSLSTAHRHPAALTAMGTVMMARRELVHAEQLLDEAFRSAHRTLGHWQAFAVGVVANLLQMLGRSADARELLEATLARVEPTGNVTTIGSVHASFTALGDPVLASKHLRSCLSLSETNQPWIWMWVCAYSGETEIQLGGAAALAASHVARAIDLAWDAGNDQIMLWMIEAAAALALREGLREEGLRLWGAAAAFARTRDIPTGWNVPHETFKNWAQSLFDEAREASGSKVAEGETFSIEETLRDCRVLLARVAAPTPSR